MESIGDKMIYYILGLLVFIIVLMVIVAVHEGGHFLIAKKSGILCHEYSLGMGPAIFQKKRKNGETVFSIRAFPIGGYVSMAGEEADEDILKGIEKIKLVLDNERVSTLVLVLDNPKYQDLKTYKIVDYDLLGTKEAKEDELFIRVVDEEQPEMEPLRFIVNRDCMVNYKKKEAIQIAPYDRRFTNKGWFKRFFSILAGPFMNFVFAWFIFLLMGIFFGYADTSTTKISEVTGSALEAGLQDDNVILKINDTDLSDWNSLQKVMAEISTGKAQSNSNPGISASGELKLAYKDNDKATEIKEVLVKPTIYFTSSDLIVKYDEELGGVVINNPTMEKTKIEKAGLKNGDLIYKINDTEINDIPSILSFYNDKVLENTKELTFYVKRKENNELKTIDTGFVVNIYTLSDLDANNLDPVRVVMGVSTGSSFQFTKLLYMPFVETGRASGQILKTLRQLFNKNSSISIMDLSGPVGIFNLFTRLVKGPDAIYNILYWTGLISVNLGVVNLLPIPALDGGRIVFLLYEAITRRKPTPKVENIIITVSFVLLLALSAFILISDIIKCF